MARLRYLYELVGSGREHFVYCCSSCGCVLQVRRGLGPASEAVGQPNGRCVGCGRRAPQQELIRFVAQDGVLVAGRRAPGRGAYTCASLACYERAAARGGLARALRRAVRIDPTLARPYTGGLLAREANG